MRDASHTKAHSRAEQQTSEVCMPVATTENPSTPNQPSSAQESCLYTGSLQAAGEMNAKLLTVAAAGSLPKSVNAPKSTGTAQQAVPGVYAGNGSLVPCQTSPSLQAQ